jgi:hypothetical protein
MLRQRPLRLLKMRRSSGRRSAEERERVIAAGAGLDPIIREAFARALRELDWRVEDTARCWALGEARRAGAEAESEQSENGF